jgi:hypothetical protein
VMALAAASPTDVELGSDSDEIDVTDSVVRLAGAHADAGPELVAGSDQLSAERPVGRRGRTATEPGAVTFIAGRNARGTSVTYRVAWRARAVRQDPEAFLEHVRALLQAIAADATADYDSAMAAGRVRRRRRRGGGVSAATDAWRDAITREEAELAARVADAGGRGSGHGGAHTDRQRGESIPDDQNPMPVPPSQRRPGDAAPAISPRLLAGLSIPMLAERLKRRAPEFNQLETHLSDVERQAEDARRRVRDLVDAEEAGRRTPPGAS